MVLVTDSIKPPSISIIIPIHNSESTLKQCLDSLLNQSFSDIEVVCVNDGSTDKSQKIIEEYMRKDSRVKLITQNYTGDALARNKGRYLARGEYIVFMNSDDYAKSEMIGNLYKNAKEHESDIVLFLATNLNPFNMEFSDEEFPFIEFSDDYDNRAFSPQETYDFMFKIKPDIYNKMFKRDILEKNNITFIKGLNYEYYLFFIQAYLSSRNISLLRNSLLVHRNSNKKGFKEDLKKLDLFKIFNIEKDYLIRKKLYKELKYQFEKSKKNILISWSKTISSFVVKILYSIKLFSTYPFQKLK